MTSLEKNYVNSCIYSLGRCGQVLRQGMCITKNNFELCHIFFVKKSNFFGTNIYILRGCRTYVHTYASKYIGNGVVDRRRCLTFPAALFGIQRERKREY